jgi:hypothetical protein
MLSVFASSVVDGGFEPVGFKQRTIKLVFADFPHAILTSKNKDWLVRNQDNVERHVYSRNIVSVS